MLAKVGLQMLRLIILARLLPAKAFGLMAIVMVIVGFVQIFGNLGLSEAIIQRSDPTKEELSTLYWTNIGAGIVIFFLLLLSTPLVANIYDSPEIRSLLPPVAAIFLVAPWGTQFKVLLQKSLQFRSMALIEITGELGNTLTAVFFAFLDFGIWSLVWGVLVGTMIQSALLVVCGFSSDNRPMVHFRCQDLKGYLDFGMHRVGALSLNYFNSRVDQLLVGALLGPQMLGYYSMAFNLVIQPVQMINPVLTKVAFPVFSQIKSDIQKLRQGYLRILRILLGINAPILVGVSVVSPVAVPLILGDKWFPAVSVIQILAFYTMFRIIGNAGGGVILARGRADLTFYWNLALILLIPVTVYMAGLTGKLTFIALALLSLQVILMFANYRFLISKVLGPCFRGYLISIALPFGISVLMGALVFFLRKGVSQILGPWMTLLVTVGSGVFLYVLLVKLFNKDDLQEFLCFLPRFVY